MKILIDAGAVPVLQVSDSGKALAYATEYRAAIAPLIEERESLADKKARSGWLPQSEYDRWYRLCHVLYKASTLKTHTNRMALLAKMARNAAA